MNVHVVQGAIQRYEVDTIIVNLFEGVTTPAGATGAVDSALDGAIVELIENGDLTGKAGEIVTQQLDELASLGAVTTLAVAERVVLS